MLLILEMIQLQFKDFLFNRWLGGWVGKVAGILIDGVGVVRQFYFLLKIFETLDVSFVQKCQMCVES